MSVFVDYWWEINGKCGGSDWCTYIIYELLKGKAEYNTKVL